MSFNIKQHINTRVISRWIAQMIAKVRQPRMLKVMARVSQNEECNCKLGYSGLDCGLGPIGIVLTITPSLPGIAKLERGAHKGSARNENVN